MGDTCAFYDADAALQRLQASTLFGGGRPGRPAGPFVRPLGQTEFALDDLSTPLDVQSSSTTLALFAQRLLQGIFQTDFVFLPDGENDVADAGFQESSSPEIRIACQIIRPAVERYVFGGLEADTDHKPWSARDAMQMLKQLPFEQAGTTSSIVSTVLGSADPQRAAKNLLAQFSIDFLCEGSAIARKVMGNYGAVQSALFKIFMDEYGEGVYPDKHSTLYEKLMRSHDLDPTPNAYWEVCLPTAFAVPNLFQYMAANHNRLMQYMGAVYYAETAYYHFCGQVAAMLRKVFGEETEARYFDVHYVIDQDHSRIAFERIVEPLVARFGDQGLIDIAKGYEVYSAVNALFDQDFADQIGAMDGLDALRRRGKLMTSGAGARLRETTAEPNVSVRGRLCDSGVVYAVTRGELEVSLGLECVSRLDQGDAIWIPPQRLHSLAMGPGCVYEALEEEPA